jgi:hypothetical protein
MAPTASPKEDNLKTYLDYLDKEMTIMGILSSFCMLTMGFVAEKLFFPDKDSAYKAKDDEAQVRKLLDDSDSWYNWQWYQTGFGSLTLAFLELGAVGLSCVHPFVAKWEAFIAFGLLVLCAIGTSFFVIAYARFPYDDKPLTKLWKALL